MLPNFSCPFPFMCFVYLKDVNGFHFSPKKDRPMVSTAESEVTINLPLHDLALGRVSFDFWLFLRSAWPNTLRAFFGKITLSRPWVDISLLHCPSDKKRPPGWNLGDLRSLRRAGTTSYNIALNLSFLWQFSVQVILFTQP